ncbi:MAG TPA: gluconokinase [Burkholderiales bacterium]|nr:gluconokinase [Burkholderiales bacterium]
MIVVVMGVSGSGKTEIGARLARRLGVEFIEGDDFHRPENVAKMRSGTPLQDADRWPWLERLNKELKKKQSAVLACSALKQAYRDALLKDISGSTLVHLRGSFELIESRLKARQHRYMPASLLKSQFATLEPPVGAIEVDVAAGADDCVESIARHLPG